MLDAALVCVLIGERPGLTSPDSLGVYLTWQPVIGRADVALSELANLNSSNGSVTALPGPATFARHALAGLSRQPGQVVE
jgi:ethanolamine ammonia-lyase small subunit